MGNNGGHGKGENHNGLGRIMRFIYLGGHYGATEQREGWQSNTREGRGSWGESCK